MKLDVEDENLRVTLSPVRGDPTRSRLVIEFPYEPEYRERIRFALGDFLRWKKPERKEKAETDQ